MTRSVALLFLLLPTLVSAQTTRPRNIILLIGDGFGPAHVTATRHFRADQFRIGTMPVIGFAATACADRYVTDSAAAATALATGVKTLHDAVAVDVDGKPVETVLEASRKSGKATGLVTTTAFYDATPAAFAAHALKRSSYSQIVSQMLASGVDLIASTGLGSFGRAPLAPIEEIARTSGYPLVTTRAALDAAKPGRLLAVFPSQPRDVEFPEAPLPFLTQMAIDRLKDDPDGFFLMVENEGIDSASHQNFAADVRASLISFDSAVGVALDFAAKNPDTLVVVTGDHETGALRIAESKTGRFRMEWTTVDHTAVAVPIFASGPGSAPFGRFIENTEIGKTLLSYVRK